MVLVRHGESGIRSVLVQPNPLVKAAAESKPARLGLGPKTLDISDVLARVDETSYVASWTIGMRADANTTESGSMLSCVFPSGTTLWSTSTDVDWPFEVTARGSHRNEASRVQGPFLTSECPGFEDSPGGEITRASHGEIDGIAGKCDWLELTRTAEPPAGKSRWLRLRHVAKPPEWRMRRTMVPLGPGVAALVTSQATTANASLAFDAADDIARSLHLSVDGTAIPGLGTP
jgi:hypothetical protein